MSPVCGIDPPTHPLLHSVDEQWSSTCRSHIATALDADSSTRLVAETKKAYIVVAVDMCVDLGDLVGRSALSRILEGLAGNVRR